ncbi:MAG TPA: glutamine amidotransferase [Polyangiaceae bacterium]|nr:glutamine amidotransferase [Polyangiaceae bacterium]
MTSTHLGPSADLPSWAAIAAYVIALLSLSMLFVEMRRRERGGTAILLTGLLAVGALLTAVLRPARVTARESTVGARVVILADASRSMALGGDDGRPRHEARDAAIEQLRSAGSSARLVVLGFGEGAPEPLPDPGRDVGAARDASARARRSDLATALRALALSSDERPAAVLVVSDGRLDDPPEGSTAPALAALGRSLGVPIDAVATTRDSPADASVRAVRAAGAAVAHVPLPLQVEVGCAGSIACDEVTVTAHELREDGAPALLASGVAHVKDGKATLDMTITLERAGARIVQIAISPPPGDTIPDNDRRLVTFDVARERVRVLHVAGRPTVDVRALRQWLKGDASIDLVAFFILRTHESDVRATSNELALIPFPVDELFTEHLPSFDAVVLQDFDAQPYGLEKYLENIRQYVRRGGGLVMVGGQNSFVAGGYAGTPLADVLPVELDGSRAATSADPAAFEPQWTPEGLAAPLLGPLRDVMGGEDLPEMPGANLLGDVRPGGVVLWSHPTRLTPRGAKMPVLAIGEEGDGRTIALGMDGAWRLEFSALAARTAGRGHGALWDGLLGWLMRDPRFEPARVEIVGSCIAGLPATLRAHVLAGRTAGDDHDKASVAVDVARLDASRPPLHVERPFPQGATSLDIPLPPLEAGGYVARLRAAGGATTRYDFACEGGGDEWADSRPDPARLEALAKATGGGFALASNASSLRLPGPTVVSAERHVTPVAPPWAWTLAAAVLLGVHWTARRRSGLS